jgi:hypothetical protein
MFNMLREKIGAMSSKVCQIVTKRIENSDGKMVDNPKYDAEKTQYERNGVIITDTKNSSFMSASNGIYYQLDKTKQSERTADQNRERLAVSLLNLENRFGKHAFQIFDQGNKIIELLNGTSPCDPAWANKFLQDLAEMATAFKRVAERNESKFADHSFEPDAKTSASTDKTTRVWSPV